MADVRELALLRAAVVGLVSGGAEGVGPWSASGLDCFADSAGTVKKDCGMHTGCMKKFEKKTQRTLERSCFLTPGQNDTCFTDDDGSGVCYCHSDLCNHAAAPARPIAATALAVAAATLIAGGAILRGGG